MTTWLTTYVEEEGIGTDAEAALVTVRLEKVVYLSGYSEIALRACRPFGPDHTRRNRVPWRPARGTSRLTFMFDGRRGEGPEARWDDLPAALKTTLCVEFLRHHESSGVPRLKHLLLPQTNLGRDVNIFGVSEDGKEILA